MGITGPELETLRNPKQFYRPRDPVCQPSLKNASEHRLVYPRDEYEMIVGLPDELVTESTRDIVPPGKSG